MNHYTPKSEDLKKRIRIAKAVQSKNDRGVVTWTYPGTADVICWASIEPYGSTIIHGEAAKVSEVQYRITIRYRQLNMKDKIIYQGRTFTQTIPAVDLNMQHQWLELTCSEAIKVG